MAPLPRVLVLSQVVPETRYAGSVVLHRLFQGYPTDRILVAGPRPQRDSQALDCRYVELPLSLDRLTRTRFNRLVRSLQVSGFLPGPGFGSRVRAAIDDFQPEVVVTVMQTQPYYQLAYRYAKARRLPLVLIVHDIAEKFEPVYGWAAGRQFRRNQAVYRYAASRLCVSPQMADHLEGKFGAAGEVMYPNRSEALTPRNVDEAKRLREPGILTIGYAGSLAYGYGEQLKRMVSTFADSNSKLRLYTPTKPDWAAAPNVLWCGFAESPLTTWRRIQAECDAVILPYDWRSSELDELYRTHFPSKLTEYVALGMPVLVFGPVKATGVRWALDNAAAALAVTVDDPQAWTAAMVRQREDSELRFQLAEKAGAAGLAELDPVSIRTRFHARLHELSAPGMQEETRCMPKAEQRQTPFSQVAPHRTPAASGRF